MYTCDGCKELQAKLDEQKKQLDRLRGMFQMLICVCGHKQHAHEEDEGECDRCSCMEFREEQR